MNSGVRNVPGPFPGESWRDNAADVFVTSPDRSILAVIYWRAHAQLVALYSTRTWEVIGSLPGSMFGVVSADSLAFSRDGKLLAVGGFDGSVKIYDVATRMLLRRIVAYNPLSTRNVQTVSFSPDGGMIVTGAWIGLTHAPPVADPVRIFRVDDGAKIASFPEDLTPVFNVDWSPVGDTIAMDGGAGDLRLWHPFAEDSLGPSLKTRAYPGCLAFSLNRQELAVCNREFLTVFSSQGLWKKD